MTLTKTENIMETKFTKGEWEVGNKNYIQVHPDNPLETVTIGSVFGSGDEAEANAKLIAAAPGMYEALLHLTSAIVSGKARAEVEVKNALKAIQKATE